MTLKSPYVCLSKKLALFLTVKYRAKISVLNLRKYLTIKSIVIPDPGPLTQCIEIMHLSMFSPIGDRRYYPGELDNDENLVPNFLPMGHYFESKILWTCT